jgi:hypothetical protein
MLPSINTRKSKKFFGSVSGSDGFRSYTSEGGN